MNSDLDSRTCVYNDGEDDDNLMIEITMRQ